MHRVARKHRGLHQTRATRVATGLAVALSVFASTLAVGCGSSSSIHSSGAGSAAVLTSAPTTPLAGAAPPEAERSFEQQTSRAEQAYHSQVVNLCAEIHQLPRFSPRGEGPQQTSEEAEWEIQALERVRRRIDRLRALPFMRADRQTYLNALASALLLDRRIVADGGEEPILHVAMTQYEDNIQHRSKIAERLRIWCLVQTEPT